MTSLQRTKSNLIIWLKHRKYRYHTLDLVHLCGSWSRCSWEELQLKASTTETSLKESFSIHCSSSQLSWSSLISWTCWLLSWATLLERGQKFRPKSCQETTSGSSLIISTFCPWPLEKRTPLSTSLPRHFSQTKGRWRMKKRELGSQSNSMGLKRSSLTKSPRTLSLAMKLASLSKRSWKESPNKKRKDEIITLQYN